MSWVYFKFETINPYFFYSKVSATRVLRVYKIQREKNIVFPKNAFHFWKFLDFWKMDIFIGFSYTRNSSPQWENCILLVKEKLVLNSWRNYVVLRTTKILSLVKDVLFPPEAPDSRTTIRTRSSQGVALLCCFVLQVQGPATIPQRQKPRPGRLWPLFKRLCRET